MIIGIWAQSKNGVIGVDGRLPWHLPADLKHFKERTMDNYILMGRKTFDGMNQRILGGRTTVVLTRDKNYIPNNDDVLVFNSVEDVLAWYETIEKDLFIVGGAAIFDAFMDHLEMIYKTTIDFNFSGDTFMDHIDYSKFFKSSVEYHEKDEKNMYIFKIERFETK